MVDDSSPPIPHELQVWVDTEISVAGLDAPPVQQRVQSLLAALPGIESVSFIAGKLAIHYDPELTTTAEFCEAIAQAGFDVSEVETAPAAPIIDVSGEERPRSA